MLCSAQQNCSTKALLEELCLLVRHCPWWEMWLVRKQQGGKHVPNPAFPCVPLSLLGCTCCQSDLIIQEGVWKNEQKLFQNKTAMIWNGLSLNLFIWPYCNIHEHPYSHISLTGCCPSPWTLTVASLQRYFALWGRTKVKGGEKVGK